MACQRDYLNQIGHMISLCKKNTVLVAQINGVSIIIESAVS